MIEVSAILLAGGKSRRMGLDKCLLPFKGQSMLAHQVEKLQRLGISDIMISGRETAVAGTRCVMDLFPDRGPLGGLHACLSAALFPDCLVLGVDTPLVPEDTLRTLIETHLSGDQSITLLTRGDCWEPLLAVYRASLAPVALRILEAGDGSLRRFIRENAYRLLPYRGPEELITNCNTPEEYNQALAIAGEMEDAEGGRPV